MALASRGVISAYASSQDDVDDPVALVSRMAQVTDDESDEDDDEDTPFPTDNDGFDTPATDYDGIDTPATDNDGVETPLSTDDGVNTPYTDYDGVDFPAIPTLRVEAKDNSIELTWNAVAAADYYWLWAWDEVDGFRLLGEDRLNAASHTDSKVASGRTYHYTIRAANEEGESSGWSAYVSVRMATAAERQLIAPDTDNDGYDTPETDYDGINTPMTDNDGVDTPLTTDNDGVLTPYTDYDGTDSDGTDSDGIDTPTPTDSASESGDSSDSD